MYSHCLEQMTTLHNAGSQLGVLASQDGRRLCREDTYWSLPIATFQRLMQMVMEGLMLEKCNTYIDDIGKDLRTAFGIIFGASQVEAANQPREELSCLPWISSVQGWDCSGPS